MELINMEIETFIKSLLITTLLFIIGIAIGLAVVIL